MKEQQVVNLCCRCRCPGTLAPEHQQLQHWVIIPTYTSRTSLFNTLGPRWNEQHFADDIFKRIFFNENVWISLEIWVKFVPKGPINNIPALVQIMAWRCLGDKPLSEPKMVSLPAHICVTRPQCVKVDWFNSLALEIFKLNFRLFIFKQISVIAGWCIFSRITLSEIT